MKYSNVFSLARSVCEDMNGSLQSAEKEAISVEATIDVMNENQMKAVKILLETAISKEEIAEYNSKVDHQEEMRDFSHDPEAIKWGADYLGDGKAKFTLSMGSELTQDNVRFLLGLSLEGKFKRVQSIIEDLFPYNAKTDSEENVTTSVIGGRVEDEIGGEVLDDLVQLLCESHGIDIPDPYEFCANVYKPSLSLDGGESFVVVKASGAFIREFTEKVNLHVEARAKEKEDLELIKNIIPGTNEVEEMDLRVRSGKDHVTVTLSRDLLVKLLLLEQKEQESKANNRSKKLEEILQKGAGGSHADKSKESVVIGGF